MTSFTELLAAMAGDGSNYRVTISDDWLQGENDRLRFSTPSFQRQRRDLKSLLLGNICFHHAQRLCVS